MSELSSSSYGEPILENNFVIVQGRVSKHGVGTLYKTHFVLSLSAANCLTRYFLMLNGVKTKQSFPASFQHYFYWQIIDCRDDVKLEISLRDVVGCHCINSKYVKSYLD